MAVQPTAIAKTTRGVSDCLQDLSVIAGVRQRGVSRERHAVSVQDESVVRRNFRVVNRSWPSVVAPAECANHNAFDDRQLAFKDAGLLKQRG